MEHTKTDVNEMVGLLEGSVLPLMAEMIKAMGEHSYRYEGHIKEIDSKIGNIESSAIKESADREKTLQGIQEVSNLTEKLFSESVGQEEAFNVLVKTITAFGERMAALIDTNNKLVKHQQLQINKIDEAIYAFQENTARLDTLTLTVKDYTGESGNASDLQLSHPSSQKVNTEKFIGPPEKPTDLMISNEDSKPIHEVLADEIQRLKNNTKG